MIIKYLGTAAAEGIPAIFCKCETCREAAKRGGKELRTRSQAIIDDRLLVDFPPDAYIHSVKYGLDLSQIKSLLITHTHSDHLYGGDLGMRRPGFSDVKGCEPLTVYGSFCVGSALSKLMFDTGLTKNDTVRFCEVKPFVPFKLEGCDITAFPARHDAFSGPLFYSVGRDEKALLYCHDTGLFFEEVWSYFEKTKPHFDLVSLDCTAGDTPIDYDSHGNLQRCAQTRRRLLDGGYCDEKTVFILNHFSHNGGHVLYKEFSEIAAKEGFTVSYDGMTVEI